MAKLKQKPPLQRGVQQFDIFLPDQAESVILDEHEKYEIDRERLLAELFPPPEAATATWFRPPPPRIKIKQVDVAETEESESDTEEAEADTEEAAETAAPPVIKKPAAPIRVKAAPAAAPIRVKAPALKNIAETPDTSVETLIQGEPLQERLPPRNQIEIRTSRYYLNNRKIAQEKLEKFFEPYREELENMDPADLTCDKQQKNDRFELLMHQKIVRDYLNLLTPYRGVLLYHGLGSGKTCTSIAVAEGMKTQKEIILLTPASLRSNFFSELKKCGDPFVQVQQFWEFIPAEGDPEMVKTLSHALSLDMKWIRAKGGAWLMDIRKPPNFSQLDREKQDLIQAQLDEMIRSRYIDINYNGNNLRSKIESLSMGGRFNPFDGRVVIVDEAHNFVSRIVNQLSWDNKRSKWSAATEKSVSFEIYNYLMSAENARIVLLSGTPIINYPHEIAIMFNILRGFIQTWEIPVERRLVVDDVVKALREGGVAAFDYVNVRANIVILTRNPFGFVNADSLSAAAPAKKNGGGGGGGGGRTRRHRQAQTTKGTRRHKEESLSWRDTGEEPPEGLDAEVAALAADPYDRYSATGGAAGYRGVKLDETGNISNADFLAQVMQMFKSKGWTRTTSTQGIALINNKSLPDVADKFMEKFVNIEKLTMRNRDVFQKRILGLTSYFRSEQENLLPRLIKSADGSDFFLQKVPMSDYQLAAYIVIRNNEYEEEKRQAKNVKRGGEAESVFEGSYRIYSRAICNFAFPEKIPRPKVGDFNDDPDLALPETAAPEEQAEENKDYQSAIADTLSKLALPENRRLYLSPEGLRTYSPKFARILENVRNPDHAGKHLIYSQFRHMEGIAILKLVLETSGMSEFRIRKTGRDWDFDFDNPSRPRFVLYTGTESPEEKEVLLNIYNGNWHLLPPSMQEKLEAIPDAAKNTMGTIIKVIMITQSGAEGINLRNTRFVHIVEPYWHMVRIHQVVGRARRICSHQDLPEELRTVQVFIYLTTFSEEQNRKNREGTGNKQLALRDVSRLETDAYGPVAFTTDQTLYEKAYIKDNLNETILDAVKETAMDCSVVGDAVCYAFQHAEADQFAVHPNIEQDLQEINETIVVKKKFMRLKHEGRDYAVDPAYRENENSELYDLEAYRRGELERVGEIVRLSDGQFQVFLDEESERDDDADR